MNEQITSAAELDALPVGSVVVVPGNPYGDSVWGKAGAGWLRTGDHGASSSESMYRRLPLTVLYRPDQPQRVQPSQEGVAEAILAHFHAPDSLHGTWWRRPYAAADDVLALFAQQPTVAEAKAEALREAAEEWWILNRINEEPGDLAAGIADRVNDFINSTTDEWLNLRADRLEAEARQ